ncbi:MAG: hypothetical protein WB558_04785 [Terriglobales bacterium]
MDSEERRYLSAKALRRLLYFLQQIKLIEIQDEITLTAAGREALKTEAYDRIVSRLVLEYLWERGISLDTIHAMIESIELPEVPEPSVIFEKLTAKQQSRISQERFRRLLYLLACTKRLGRNLKVIYGRR